MPEALVPKSKHTALEQRVVTLEQNPGGGSAGYTETVTLGAQYRPRPNDDVLDVMGYEFTSSVAATITAIRFWARLPPDSAQVFKDAYVRVFLNDDDRSNIPVKVYRGTTFVEALVFLAEPVSVAVGDRVGFALQTYVAGSTPQLLGTYTEAQFDYYGFGYDALNGWIMNASVSEDPVTYVRTPHSETGDVYPVVQFLTTSGRQADPFPHGRFRRVVADPAAETQQNGREGWSLRDGSPTDGTLPGVMVEYNGRIYEALLYPVDLVASPTDPTGLYVPRLAQAAGLTERRMAWVNGQLLAMSPDGGVYQIPVTPLE